MKKYLPILLIALAAIGLYFSGLLSELNFASLEKHRLTLDQFSKTHPLLAPLLFMLAYIAMAALSLPFSIILDLVGGYLFPQPYATLLIVISGTIGASLIFLSAKTAFGDLLRKRAGPTLLKFEQGFQKNGGSYLLFLRLIPIFPFWIVNLAPAFFGIPFRTFFWTTLIGIIPASFAYSQIGAGLGTFCESGQELSPSAFFNWEILSALVGLSLFAIIPILLKTFWKK
jgi:uncharacterized membrane protein YdjX (TVP38/TMEM64 family)